MKKRTQVDFSKHTITESKEGGVLIHRFREPGTMTHAVTFINAAGVLAVTGDFGNWIFCREFHPSKKGGVSDSYWCEKLKIASTQNPYDYDADGTEKELEEKIADEETSAEAKEFYTELLEDHVHESEEVYLAEAHGHNMPKDVDHEDIPHCKKLKFWLAAVFDAFEAMCALMPEEVEAAKP